MGWLRKSAPFDAALHMVGPKAGNRVLLVGARDAGLAARVAAVTGLNGSATVLLPSEARRGEVESAAAQEGALVEVVTAPGARLPFDEGTLDLAVIDAATEDSGSRPETIAEALRVVRPGGRVVVVLGARRTGVLHGFLRDRTAPSPGTDAMMALLSRAGARGVRVLASLEGRTFIEGARGR